MKWGIAFVLLAALAVAGWYFTRTDESAPVYQTVVVTRGDLLQAVTATGTLNPVTNITVGSQISGIIQKLYVDWNSPVKANQVVAELDPATFKASVAQAEGDLANSKANLELSQIQAKRAGELFKNQLISESEHDTAIANLHQAQAMVADQGGLAVERAGQFIPLHHLFPRGRHRHFAQRGCRPNRRSEPLGANAIHHRQRSLPNAD